MWLKTNLAYLLLITILLISGCIDPINLTLEDDGEFLVIDATFTPNRPIYEAKLYFATSLRTKGQRFVENAQVVLVEDNQIREACQYLRRGEYQLTPQQIKGEAGKSYHIEVTLPTGESYQSVPEILPPLIEGDSVFFEFSIREEIGVLGSTIRKPYVEAYVATPLPSNQSFWLKWEVANMYSFPESLCGPMPPPALTCFVTVDNFVREINVFNGTNIEANYLPKFKVGEKELPSSDFEFRERYYFLANQQSITEGAYNYWNKINLIANQSGSIFDAPPAEIRGNLVNINDPDEIVLGYFEVAHTDSLRGFVNENALIDFHQFSTNYCATTTDPFSRNNRECCACQLIDGELTLERPSWW